MTIKRFFFLSFSALVIPTIALADVDLSANGITAIMGRVADWLWAVAFGLIVIVFIWAGVKYLLTRGDPGKITEANHMVVWALVGAAVVMLAWSAESLVRFILGI